jgi:hypothetical protein
VGEGGDEREEHRGERHHAVAVALPDQRAQLVAQLSARVAVEIGLGLLAAGQQLAPGHGLAAHAVADGPRARQAAGLQPRGHRAAPGVQLRPHDRDAARVEP